MRSCHLFTPASDTDVHAAHWFRRNTAKRASETRCAARRRTRQEHIPSKGGGANTGIFIMAPQQSPPLGAVRTSVGGEEDCKPACDGPIPDFLAIWRNRHDPSTICAGSRMGHLLGRPTYASGSLAQIASTELGRVRQRCVRATSQCSERCVSGFDVRYGDTGPTAQGRIGPVEMELTYRV